MNLSIKLLSSLIALRQIGPIGAELDPNLPWDNLADRLSAKASLLPKVSNQDYVDECWPEFRDKPLPERSIKNLESQPSGLCLHALSCGFENCVEPIGTDWTDTSNPLFSIPSAVVFPAVAGGVVAVVEFAIKNGIELSVKNSGHNQVGASGKKDTLLVNTQRYAEYASTGIVECTNAANNVIVNQDLSNQACLLALARDKKAYIRVGGGENWSDVYGSVKAFNEAQESYRYHAVGGAVGTVTPMGWTFQGGLGGSAGGRMYGFGVDQVLQIEAVLPNGQHVRFGPTAWEDAEGYSYPKTIAVSGVCNTKPEELESNWIWEACPMEINFDDLWFAMRGGGGGTWGVVTSIYLQLHDWLPLELVPFPTTPGAAENLASTCNVKSEDTSNGIGDIALRFFYDYMFDPSSLGVSEEESAACGAPANFPLYCYGEGMGQKFVSTFKTHLLERKQELLDNGNSEEAIDKVANCFSADSSYKDVIEEGSPANEMPNPGMWCNAFSNDNIAYIPLLIPLSFYREEKETYFKFVANGTFTLAVFGGAESGPYFAHTGRATDQTTSLSKAHYNAGFMMTGDNPAMAEILNKAYGISSTDTTIPAHLGGNHYLSRQYGPLKSDPTKYCDLQSVEDPDEECFPTQDILWGENLARLEAIKKEIDPSGIFNCNKCVGNNKAKVTVGSSKDSGEL